jgi:hypothetical protein
VASGLSASVSFSNVEDFTLDLLGADDSVSMNDPTSSVAANLGAGNDEVSLAAGSPYRHVSVTGGDGDDALNIAAVDYTSASFDGGGGGEDSIALTNTRDGSTWSIYPASIERSVDFELTHSSVSRISIQANAGSDLFRFIGPPQDAMITLSGGGGDDEFHLGSAPLGSHDQLLLDGQAGDADRVYHADGTFATSYDVTASSFARQDGRGADMSSVEVLTLQTGGGADTIHAHDLAGMRILSFGLASGDDRVAAHTGDASNLTLNISTGNGTDVVEIDDSAAATGALYTLNDNGLSRPGLTVGGLQFGETLVLTGTEFADRIDVTEDFTLASFEVRGAGGDDVMAPGFNGISGFASLPMHFAGGAGEDAILIDNAAAAHPATVHVSSSGVSAVPGDNLFGSDGSLRYVEVEHVDLRLGSAADTVYAAPSASTDYLIAGHDPTANPNGDAIHVALANTTAPVFTPGPGPGDGMYTFADRMPIVFRGFENRAEDDSAPAVASASFDVDVPRQRVRFTFSEDVSRGIGVDSLRLVNLTTGADVPAAAIRLTYDGSTDTASFDFPGFVNGVLPDGDYRATLHGDAVSDLAGNTMNSDFTLEFFFLQGDANRDRRVDLVDFNRLALNFGLSNRAFTQGDFNYDGLVNLSDFDVLAARFGGTLPVAGNASGTAAEDAEDEVVI